MCEEWREYKQNIPSGHLTDVHNGHLWHEWTTYNGKPFLQMPGNVLLMLDVHWFQAFIDTQYIVGVIFLVIQKLSWAVRFKPENIIIVSTIPGPKEPDYNDMNNYLVPVVNDLISFWNGINVTSPQSVLRSKLIWATLCYISSDLPATSTNSPPSNIVAFHSIYIYISADFADFTAEQWMHWTTLFSPLVLRDHLPLEHFTNWCLFAKACSLMCRAFVHVRKIEEADELLTTFCTGLERLYGKKAITPNMHLHGHLAF